ncbi:hypothetical protein COPCOM_02329 [Coprococcus comes ATCC 27758]|uniref:Uncharacterized protein n=1 Tax=Coprococcus comes ATCC 27758 TaxID=470146 RepID=C0BB73_9FIRM|nr:hypothetical protein COPCOM_02329 [Coprococcus comes ATCC 27758]
MLEAAIKNFQFHSRDPEFWHLMQYPASQSAFDDFGRRIVGAGCLAAVDIFTGNVNETKNIFSRFVYIIKIKKRRIFFTEKQSLLGICNQSIDQFVV